jgi:hypothetical protein
VFAAAIIPNLHLMPSKGFTTKVLLPVFFGRHAIEPFEISTEMAPVLYANNAHYFLDAEKRGFQQLPGLLHFVQFEILSQRYAGSFFEQMTQARWREVHCLRKFF